jgi:hypothetical protein
MTILMYAALAVVYGSLVAVAWASTRCGKLDDAERARLLNEIDGRER